MTYADLRTRLQKFTEKVWFLVTRFFFLSFFLVQQESSAVSTLNVNSNAIDELPEEIASLPSLKTLYVMDNNLVTCPSWIGSVTRLTLLAIDRNLVLAESSFCLF